MNRKCRWSMVIHIADFFDIVSFHFVDVANISAADFHHSLSVFQTRCFFFRMKSVNNPSISSTSSVVDLRRFAVSRCRGPTVVNVSSHSGSNDVWKSEVLEFLAERTVPNDIWQSTWCGCDRIWPLADKRICVVSGDAGHEQVITILGLDLFFKKGIIERRDRWLAVRPTVREL